ncbi:hypothetical protein FACS1894159_11680 [Bacteroidia bacterium]|nr:hypothetical protein FACS1894159_11680 [Bacteroidia bacterium]
MGDCYALNEENKKQTGTAPISPTPATGSTNTYTNVSASDMAIPATFLNWDFTSVWEMGASGLPKLQGLPE